MHFYTCIISEHCLGVSGELCFVIVAFPRHLHLLAHLSTNIAKIAPMKNPRWPPFGAGEEAKIDFQDGRHVTNFAILSTGHPMLPTKFRVS